MIHNKFARKERQLNYSIKKLNRCIDQSTNNYDLEIERLLNKIKDLIDSLRYQISQYKISKILGSLSIMIGVTFTNVNNISAQSFAPPINNPFGINLDVGTQTFSTLGDLNNDGDLDILSAQFNGSTSLTSISGNVWLYQENIGTASNPQFSPPVINPFNLPLVQPTPGDDDGTNIPHLVDLDGDGDLDILATQVYSIYYGGMGFHYIENIGTPSVPNFNTSIMNPFGLTSDCLFADIVDIDNDGDFDIIGGKDYGGMIFFENIGSVTNPLFSSPITNPFGLIGCDYASNIAISDIDSDGDYDIIEKNFGYFEHSNYNYYSWGSFFYLENIGDASNPQFTLPATNPFNLAHDTNSSWIAISDFGDLDGDGDEDLICNYETIYTDTVNWIPNGNFVSYYEYNGSLNSLAIVTNGIHVELYPNPAKNILHIKGNENTNHIRIIDELGRVIKDEIISENNINIESLKQGTYFIEMLCEDKIITKKFIK